LKKKINIALILLVLVLWGTVLYKYVTHFFNNDIPTLTQNPAVAFIPEKMIKDTFALQSLNVDPFLKKELEPTLNRSISINTSSTSISVFKKPKKAVVKPVVVKIETPLPEIKYFGFIKSQEKKDELILVKVNTTLFKTRLNENCNGVWIKKIYRDSIEINFEKRKVIIRKN
jgi:type II secretory pathway component PulC